MSTAGPGRFIRVGIALSCLTICVVACGGGSPSLTEYAETLEVAVAEMNRHVDA